jgi:hypothetical protein
MDKALLAIPLTHVITRIAIRQPDLAEHGVC